MYITTFDVKNQSSKFPSSPFDDKSFIFKTIKCDNNIQLYQILVSHFILNLPLNISQPIQTFRRKRDLQPYTFAEFDKIVIDFDCDSEFNKNKILEYFSKYKCIIGASRSYDGYDNFNLKGFLFVEKQTLKELKVLHAKIQNDLKDFGYFNDDVTRVCYYTASLNKSLIFLNNDEGLLYPKIKENISSFIGKADFDIDLINTDEYKDTQDLALRVFQELGFVLKKKTDYYYNFEFKGDTDYYWYLDNPYIMNNKNRLKSINIFDVIKSKIKDTFNIQDYIKEYRGIDIDITDFDNIQVNEIIERFLFRKSNILTLKSFMGSGKTLLIGKIIKEAHQKDLRVLIVTNRVSVAQDFQNKFNLKLYLNKDYELGNSLICQYDSLWRYNIKYFDVVILDEYVSLLLHSRNNLTNNPLNLTKFLSLFDKRLVLSDAFLNDYVINILGKRNVINLCNKSKDDTPLYKIPNKDTFYHYVLKYALQGDKISVSVNNLETIRQLEGLLKSQGIRVQTITSETSDIVKKLLYQLFNRDDQDKYQVLIYSPIINVGISIMNYFDKHFHFDNASSIDAIQSLQMIKRSRRAKEIFYFVAESKKYLNINYNALCDEVVNDVHKDSSNSFLCEINDYGEMILSKMGKMCVKIDVFNNLIKRNYLATFEVLMGFNFSEKPVILDKVEFKMSDFKIDDVSLSKMYENLEYRDLNSVVIPNFDKKLEYRDLKELSKKDFESLTGIDLSDIENFKDFDYINSKVDLDIFKDRDRKKLKLIMLLYGKNKKILSYLKNYKILGMNLDLDVLKEMKCQALQEKRKDDFKFLDVLEKLRSRGFVFSKDLIFSESVEIKVILKSCGLKMINSKVSVPLEYEAVADCIVL